MTNEQLYSLARLVSYSLTGQWEYAGPRAEMSRYAILRRADGLELYMVADGEKAGMVRIAVNTTPQSMTGALGSYHRSNTIVPFIRVSSSKRPDVIAAEIGRRLLAEASEYYAVGLAAEKVEKAETKVRDETMARMLENLDGGWKGKNYDFSGYGALARISGVVGYYGQVNLTFDSLTEAEAKELIRVYRGL